jgi:serine protease Do
MPSKFGNVTILFCAALMLLLCGALVPSAFGDQFWHELTSRAAKAETLPDFVALADKLGPSVVNISTEQAGPAASESEGGGDSGGGEGGGSEGGGNEPFNEFGEPFGEPHGRSLGSGFIINAAGYILTNDHVIENGREIIVTTMDGNQYKATVTGRDAKTDIALLKINAKHDLPVAPLGDSDEVKVGQWVMTIGDPFGFDHTVTAGIISARGRFIPGNNDEFLQTDAAINPGNSGGPLFDVSGKVVGINTAIYSRTGTSAGIGFAIPIDLAKAVMDQLKSHGKVTRGWLGVEIQEVTPELAQSFGLARPDGALVANVEKDSPAAKSGIKRGDVIVKFNGHDVHEQHELPELVAETPIKKSVEVEVVRGGKHVTVPVTIGELKENEMASAGGAEQPGSGWGLQVGEITPDIAREFNLQSDKGIVVRQVKPDSPGAEAGLEQGDVILEVNHDKVNSLKDFMAHAKEAKDQKKPALLLVQRGNVTLYTVIKPED